MGDSITTEYSDDIPGTMPIPARTSCIRSAPSAATSEMPLSMEGTA